ncbi:MAG: cupin domain-containing protein [Saprospiraceae bacterium]
MNCIKLEELQQSEPLSGLKVRFVHSENMTLAFWEIKENAILPDHNHVHEQVSMVTKGEFELTVDGETKILKQGMVAIIPSFARHSARAITECEVTDTFYPVREDYKK